MRNTEAASSITPERDFSSMIWMKTPKRSKLADQRVKDLVLLSFEWSLTSKLDLEQVVTRIAAQEERKVPLSNWCWSSTAVIFYIFYWLHASFLLLSIVLSLNFEKIFRGALPPLTPCQVHHPMILLGAAPLDPYRSSHEQRVRCGLASLASTLKKVNLDPCLGKGAMLLPFTVL